jgi:hypothetical protein
VSGASPDDAISPTSLRVNTKRESIAVVRHPRRCSRPSRTPAPTARCAPPT